MTSEISFGDAAELRVDRIDPRKVPYAKYVGLEHIEPGTLRLSGVGLASDVDSQKQRFQEGDILFGKLRPYFRKVVIAPFDGVCSTDIWVVKPNDGFDRDFIFYWMASAEFIASSTYASEGSRMPRAKWDWVQRFKLPYLPESGQRTLGSTLRTLDLKIEANISKSKTLESIAQTLFRSWFVDFDPVRAKMAGEKPVGMDDATAALFPDSMEQSELGEIPAGWVVEDLSEHLAVQKGKSYRSADLADSRTALVTLKSFKRGGGYRADGLKPYVGDYKPEQLVSPGDLVVAYTDVTQAGDIIGKPAIVEPNPAFDVLVASLDVGIVTPRAESVNKSYLYNLFLQNDFQNHIASHSSGTTVLHLSRSAVESFKVPVPSQDVMLAFGRVAEPILQLKRALGIESSSLANLRDSLLPRLISGELQIPEDLVA